MIKKMRETDMPFPFHTAFLNFQIAEVALRFFFSVLSRESTMVAMSGNVEFKQHRTLSLPAVLIKLWKI